MSTAKKSALKPDYIPPVPLAELRRANGVWLHLRRIEEELETVKQIIARAADEAERLTKKKK